MLKSAKVKRDYKKRITKIFDDGLDEAKGIGSCGGHHGLNPSDSMLRVPTDEERAADPRKVRLFLRPHTQFTLWVELPNFGASKEALDEASLQAFVGTELRRTYQSNYDPKARPKPFLQTT